MIYNENNNNYNNIGINNIMNYNNLTEYENDKILFRQNSFSEIKDLKSNLLNEMYFYDYFE